MSEVKFKDYYKVLGVERTDDDEVIKKAFRRLARKYHPDVSKAADASERMQEINEAYEVLRDKEKRAAYDQVGQGWQGGQEFRPPPGWDSGFEFSGGPGAGQSGAGSAEHSAFFDALFGWHGAEADLVNRPTERSVSPVFEARIITQKLLFLWRMPLLARPVKWQCIVQRWRLTDGS